MSVGGLPLVLTTHGKLKAFEVRLPPTPLAQSLGGLYALNGDTLTICCKTDGIPPNRLDGRTPGNVLMTFERVKP